MDDVFIDDITFPAADGYLLGATLYLPRGAKRHAVLINSAAAVPRELYRGFASYLARRGCAVLTYDYRGTGDSRQKSLTDYGQPRSLVGFTASMSDWAALDGTTDRVVGCHVVGDGAAEIVQVLGIAVKMKATKADFDATMALHPTAAEELVTMRTPTARYVRQAAE